MRWSCRIAGFVLVSVLVGTPSLAQETSGTIAGTVKDATGGVLPGVTVEAASPALIEKVRVAVTDDSGNFKIVNLRPGTYTVTFTLPGFSTFKREGIELSTGFTATANADMKVGGLEETVTVSGASPVVDIQNVRTQQVLRAETLQALPSGMKDLTQFASLTLGALPSTAGRNDVGGDKGELSTGLNIHGSRGDDGRTNLDGMNTNVFYGGAGGQQRIYKFNTVAVQETVVDTGAASAETETGGANINMVPRDGGNSFKVNSAFAFTNESMASAKVPDALIARGSAPNQNSMRKVYDVGIGVGGPVIKDRIWFYSANRIWGNEGYAANNYFNKSTDFRTYVPDLANQAFSDQDYKDFQGRLTIQATTKHKFTFSEGWQKACACYMGISGASAPESTSSFLYGYPMWLSQATWSYPATNKLLLQGGASFLPQTVQFTSRGSMVPEAQRISVLEQIGIPGGAPAGYRYNALAGSTQNDNGVPQVNNNFNERFAANYITGSHAIKAGAQFLQGRYNTRGNTTPNGLNFTFRAGVPSSVTQFATPFGNNANIRATGFFVQDQWTLKKLTVNAGLRYDHFTAYTLNVDLPAGPYVPARHYDGVKNIPNFSDLSPRVGAAFDVFGNGKTAIKGAWGRYLMGQGGGTMNSVAPANAIAISTTRSWADANGNFTPDCDLTLFGANGECGQRDNPAFGQARLGALTWAENARTGWGTREYNYQWNINVQHQLGNGIGFNAGFFHTDWRNQTATVDTALTPADYNRYCITAPTDARLGDFSGDRLCGLFDKTATAVTKIPAPVLMLAKDVTGATSTPKEIFNGADFSVNARFGKGGLITGGVTLGRTDFNYCWNNDIPQALQSAQTATAPRAEGFCDISNPLWNGVGSQAKVQFVYPLPLDFVLSGTFKNIPGIPWTANYVQTSAQIGPELGRSLAANAPTATISLLPSANNAGNRGAAVFDQRLNQVDMRFTRAFRFGGSRIQASAELYNVFNVRTTEGIINTYGATWLRPAAILGGRLFKFGAQVDF